MESMDYIDSIYHDDCVSKSDLIDIITYLSYIAMDNGEHEARRFLDSLADEIEEM